MLPDWLRPLAPYSRAVKALGFPAEAAGIQGRYQRCRDHWANHIERTRAVVHQGAERAQFLLETAVAMEAWQSYLDLAPETVRYRRNAQAHRRRLADGAKHPPRSLR